MKNIVSYFLFVLMIVALYGFAFSFAQDKGADGKSIFVDKKCGTCHSVQSLDLTSKKKDATDLSTVGDTHNAEFLMKYLKKAEKIDGKEHKAAFKGTDEELKTLTDWLASLKSKK